MKSLVVTFGEVMMRLSTPRNLRFGQASSLDLTFGGGEANVAVSLANYGLNARFVTRLPHNDFGDACERFLAAHRVDTGSILRGGERLGLYFLETGAAQRGSRVIYDRAGSAFAEIQTGMVDWEDVFTGADWFHWTGITPAVSQGAAEALEQALQTARKKGLTISCDLNYRNKLWKWGKSPAEVMPSLVEFCDVVIGNEEDADKVFGIHAPGVDINAGDVEAGRYREVAAQLRDRFPRAKTIAFTLRGSLSASRNTWSAVLDHRGEFHTARQYDIQPIVDRVGGGDAFCGGLIYGLLAFPDDMQQALEFASAASCLKHSIHGDVNLVSAAEVQKLASGDASGRVSR